MLAVVTFVVLFPVYTTVIGALKPAGKRCSSTRCCPTAFTLEVFRDAWTDGHLGRYLFNSFVVAMIVTVAQVVTSVLSGYAFAMLDFPGRDVLFVVFLATMLVPLEATLVVNRRTVDHARLAEHLPGPRDPVRRHRVRHVPGAPGVPGDAGRTARSGADRRRGPPRVPPLRRRAAGASDARRAALFGFLSSWNQYLWPNLITTDDDMNTVQSGLRPAQPVASTAEPGDGGHDHRRGPDRRSPADLPEAQLVRGLTAGAVKG